MASRAARDGNSRMACGVCVDERNGGVLGGDHRNTTRSRDGGSSIPRRISANYGRTFTGPITGRWACTGLAAEAFTSTATLSAQAANEAS